MYNYTLVCLMPMELVNPYTISLYIIIHICYTPITRFPNESSKNTVSPSRKTAQTLPCCHDQTIGTFVNYMIYYFKPKNRNTLSEFSVYFKWFMVSNPTLTDQSWRSESIFERLLLSAQTRHSEKLIHHAVCPPTTQLSRVMVRIHY